MDITSILCIIENSDIKDRFHVIFIIELVHEIITTICNADALLRGADNLSQNKL